MKRFLLALVSIGLVTMSVNASYAADKYLCKWTGVSGTNKAIYTINMTAESFCGPRKYISEESFQACITKDFEELKKVYNEGKCKKYMQKIHSDTNNTARCFVDVTDDPADGYIINCYGPTANTFRPKVEDLYKNKK